MLVSDGRANAGEDPVAAAARLAKQDVQLSSSTASRATSASAAPAASRPPPAASHHLHPRPARRRAATSRPACAPSPHDRHSTDTTHTPDDQGSADPIRRKPRDKPLLIVNTGHGKGKSSAAFGMLLRSWARGYRCGVFQFVKSGKWKVGEAKAAAALGGIDWEKMGDGWSWISRDLEESADKARVGWEHVKQLHRRGALRVPAPRRADLPHQVRVDRGR